MVFYLKQSVHGRITFTPREIDERAKQNNWVSRLAGPGDDDLVVVEQVCVSNPA